MLSLRRGWTSAPWTPANAAQNVTLHPDRLDAPLHWRKPRRIFVCSMGDLFHEAVPDKFIDRVFAVMALTPQHTYQVLTKRPERMRQYITSRSPGGASPFLVPEFPLPNVWLGVSAENQRWADARIPLLLQTPAAVRFVSCEPLLGEIDLRQYLAHPLGIVELDPLLRWIIVGGESGPTRRRMDLRWACWLREQCRAAGVAYFGKQDCGLRPGMPLSGSLGDQEWPA